MVSHSFNLTPYTYASSIPLSLFKERGNKRGRGQEKKLVIILIKIIRSFKTRISA
jgi:hypothetical protein